MEHHRRLPLPEDVKASTTPPPANMTGYPMPPGAHTHNSALHRARVDLVRSYLLSPSQFPDGVDWPNWAQPHEVWFTGHEHYWIAQAMHAQGKLDAEAELAEKAKSAAPKRRSFFPEKKGEPKGEAAAARLKAANTMIANSKKILSGRKPTEEARPIPEKTTSQATATRHLATPATSPPVVSQMSPSPPPAPLPAINIEKPKPEPKPRRRKRKKPGPAKGRGKKRPPVPDVGATS